MQFRCYSSQTCVNVPVKIRSTDALLRPNEKLSQYILCNKNKVLKPYLSYNPTCSTMYYCLSLVKQLFLYGDANKMSYS